MSSSQHSTKRQGYTNPKELYRRLAVSFNLSTDESGVVGKALLRQPVNNFLRARIVQGVSLHQLLYPRTRSPDPPRHFFSYEHNSPDLRIEALRLCPQTDKGRNRSRHTRVSPEASLRKNPLSHPLSSDPGILNIKTNKLKSVPETRIAVRRKPMELKEAIKDAEWISAAKDAIPKEFSRMLNASNGLIIQAPPATWEECYRYYIGPGNNGGLVDRLMKSRKWWVRVKSIEESQFVWSQRKEQTIMNLLPISTVRTEGEDLQYNTREFKCTVKCKEPGRGAMRTVDISSLGYDRVLGHSSFRILKPMSIISALTLRTHNKLECNYNLANKKALFLNMKQYYEAKGLNYLSQMPLTFHIVNGEHDPEFKKFEAAFKAGERRKEKAKWEEDSEPFYNLWIVKPGENSNRGQNITVANMIEHVKTEVRTLVCPETGKRRTYIVQKYIENPFLYKNRKFDIRCYSLITSINGVIQGYYYPEGYIRTSCREFDLESVFDLYIHLTNDAVQKHAEEYGRFEMANKLSYLDFQRYLDQRFPEFSPRFQAQVLPTIKRLIKDTMEATFLKLDPKRRNPTFEVFGYDFMLDAELKPWLIEVNTNPCLELSSACLGRVIPSMLEGAFKIVLDSWFPEPPGGQKRRILSGENLYENKWELLFSEEIDGKMLRRDLETRGTLHLIEQEDPALLDLSDEEEMHSDPESEPQGD